MDSERTSLKSVSVGEGDVATASESRGDDAYAWRAARAFDAIPDAVVVADGSGRIVLVNRAAEETLGYGRGELPGLCVEALLPAPLRAGHVAQRERFTDRGAPHTLASNRSRLWALRKDGTTIPVEISLNPLESDGGRLVVASIRDVTQRVRVEEERARLEDQLRQAHRLESLGTLAGGVAHDFNNILNAIVSNVDLARSEPGLAPPVAESLAEIAGASARAAGLVKRLLAFSRGQPSSRVATVVRVLVEEVCRLLRANLPVGVHVVTEFEAETPRALVDATQIHQVLLELGSNASHAVHGRPARLGFHVDTTEVPAGRPNADGLAPGRYVRVRVADDGVGMDAATRARIFEPFFTTKGAGKGTGLGLSVAHGIVADHGGAIAVESVLGRGTTVSVFLPEAVDEEAAAKAARPAPGIGSSRVLLVDDEPALVRAVTRLLERFGYQVTFCNGGARALSVLRADPYRFDVVLTDLHMPDISGLDLARAIGTIRPGLPVVLATANRTHSDAELDEANIRVTLLKPYSGDALADALERALAWR